jgi:hypothetical protein
MFGPPFYFLVEDTPQVEEVEYVEEVEEGWRKWRSFWGLGWFLENRGDHELAEEPPSRSSRSFFKSKTQSPN